jgi:ATP-binding cassette subfamily C (CFTR/MRP) protein 1
MSACIDLADAQIFAAETVDTNQEINRNMDVALRLTKVTFRWSAIPEDPMATSETKSSQETSREKESISIKSFSLTDLDLTIPRGRLIALVGRVGSGKSSLLQGVSLWCCLD